MRGSVRRGLAALLLSTALVVGSCGGDSCACTYPSTDRASIRSLPDDGPVIATSRRQGQFDPGAAPVEVLSRARGCLVFGGAVPLWPPGTRWDDATASVRVPGWSAVIRTGRSTTLGGGFMDLPGERPAWLPRQAYREAGACVDRLERVRQVFLVANEEPPS